MRAKINAIAASTWRVCIIAVALVVVLSCSAFAKRAITRVDIANKADRTVICVWGNSPLSVMPFSSTAGHYMGFQFPFALQAKGRTVGVHSGGIFCVKYSNFRSNPPVTRIVANTSDHLRYSTDWSADKKQLTISIWKRGCNPVAETAPVKAVAPVAAAVKHAEPAQPVAPVLSSETSAEQAAPASSVDAAAPRVRLTDRSNPLTPKVEPKAAYQMAAAQPEITTKVMGMVETASQPAPVRVARVINIPKTLSVKPVMAKATTVVAAPEPVVEHEKTVSINFLGADINDVLKALSIQSGQNIVVSKDVKGEVTVSLNNVSLDDAMDYVAKLSGYTYTKANGTYLVAPKQSIQGMTGEADAEIQTDVYALSYSKADDVASMLEKMFPDLKTSKGKDGKSGSGAEGDKKDEAQALEFIAVSAPPATLKEVKRIITQMEDCVQNRMASLTTEIYTVSYSSPKMIAESILKLVPGVLVGPAPSSGFQFSTSVSSPTSSSSGSGSGDSGASSASSSSSGASTGKTTDVYGRTCQALTITGPAEQVKRAMELAARLDVKSPLINIEAKVTSISKSGAEEIGMKWNWGDISFYEGFTDFIKQTNTTGLPGENLQNIRRTHNLWDRQPFDFAATLDALVTHGNARLLASPNLLCMEGMPGLFFVGDEVTYIQRIETTATGQNITTDTKKVGVQLMVVGDVNPDGYITLMLHPEVSTLRLSVDKGVTLPVVSRRFTDHVVRVKNGETIAIGGLIRSDEIQDMTKIPLLGDLPFLGKLFQHKSKSTSENEVVMFITAKVVED